MKKLLLLLSTLATLTMHTDERRLTPQATNMTQVQITINDHGTRIAAPLSYHHRTTLRDLKNFIATNQQIPFDQQKLYLRDLNYNLTHLPDDNSEVRAVMSNHDVYEFLMLSAHTKTLSK